MGSFSLRCARSTLRRSFSSAAHRNGRPPRMAVVGSGPAGFYTAYRVMNKIPGAKVDMYESLPVPFGLVRFGVAPDHPEVKNCQDKFDEVARSPGFTFVGNVSVGSPSRHADGNTVPLPALARSYDAVVFAYGASRDKSLGVPGEAELRGIYSAREFVGWYNGLPEHADLAPDLTRGEDAVIVGQGNVALDVARMLLESIDVLRKSDITAHALDVLAASRIKRVHIVGRRGPMQAAFTIKEIRELMNLEQVGFHPADPSLIPQDTKKLPRSSRRLMEILLKGSATSPETAPKSWSLDFCLSPTAFEADPSDSAWVGATVLAHTTLSSPFDPAAQAVATGATTRLPSPTVFRSIGYRSAALDGFAELGVPFDERRGIIQNDGLGRVQREARARDGGVSLASVPGLYCAGWVKRGPAGVIASTMTDAFATADAIAADWEARVPFLEPAAGEGMPAGWEGVQDQIEADRTAPIVRWHDWQRIDEAERDRGKKADKEREKLTSTADMLAVVG